MSWCFPSRCSGKTSTTHSRSTPLLARMMEPCYRPRGHLRLQIGYDVFREQRATPCRLLYHRHTFDPCGTRTPWHNRPRCTKSRRRYMFPYKRDRPYVQNDTLPCIFSFEAILDHFPADSEDLVWRPGVLQEQLQTSLPGAQMSNQEG